METVIFPKGALNRLSKPGGSTEEVRKVLQEGEGILRKRKDAALPRGKCWYRFSSFGEIVGIEPLDASRHLDMKREHPQAKVGRVG